jgi:hypothetical protein
MDGQSLNWDWNGLALKVFKVKGTLVGDKTFYLNNWAAGNGGEWEHWFVSNGILTETAGTAIDCQSVAAGQLGADPGVRLYPNPAGESININFSHEKIDVLWLLDVHGKNSEPFQIFHRDIMLWISIL